MICEWCASSTYILHIYILMYLLTRMPRRWLVEKLLFSSFFSLFFSRGRLRIYLPKYLLTYIIYTESCCSTSIMTALLAPTAVHTNLMWYYIEKGALFCQSSDSRGRN